MWVQGRKGSAPRDTERGEVSLGVLTLSPGDPSPGGLIVWGYNSSFRLCLGLAPGLFWPLRSRVSLFSRESKFRTRNPPGSCHEGGRSHSGNAEIVLGPQVFPLFHSGSGGRGLMSSRTLKCLIHPCVVVEAACWSAPSPTFRTFHAVSPLTFPGPSAVTLVIHTPGTPYVLR